TDTTTPSVAEQHGSNVIELLYLPVRADRGISNGGEVEEPGVAIQLRLQLALRRTQVLVLHFELDSMDRELVRQSLSIPARRSGRIVRSLIAGNPRCRRPPQTCKVAPLGLSFLH